MRVLHVSLGWPPFRTGGLVRYCCDLMEEQVRQGHTVGMLYPAGNSLTGRARVRKGARGGVASYALYSRNLVPLVFGASDPGALDCSDDAAAYEWLLDDFRPDVIHVHSIQGVGEHFFRLAKERGTRMVLTTHDYYPLCLRCNMMDVTGSLCPGPSPERCARCNKGTGLTARKSTVMQSSAYRLLKGSRLGRQVRARAKASVALRGEFSDVTQEDVWAFGGAIALRRRIVAMMDVIHANSKLAERVYRTVFPDAEYRVLPITHAGLEFKSVKKAIHSPLRIGYVGGANEYKGYRVLLEALAMLPANLDWVLLFYGTPPFEDTEFQSIRERIKYLGVYTAGELNRVFSEMDILVVPSNWPETFGFVVIEAMSVGTNVIASNSVGSSFLLEESSVFPRGNPRLLADAINRMTEKEGLDSYQKNKSAEESKSFINIRRHCEAVYRKLYQ